MGRERESGGWEGEMGREEGSLVVASREAIAQKRKEEEREKRRKLVQATGGSQVTCYTAHHVHFI